MPFVANVLQVMIASPGDVVQEREIVTEEVHRWNDANSLARKLVLLPVKWETHSTPQLGGHPQSILNDQLLRDADIVIGIFGTRIGTPTEEFASGTVEEVKRHVTAGKIAKLYFSDVPTSPSAVNQSQYASLLAFRAECQKAGLYHTYPNLEQFRRDIGHHLDIELNQPRYRWLLPPNVIEASETELSENAIVLLRALEKEENGTFIFQYGTGFGLSVGDRTLSDGSSRSDARWNAVVKDLVVRGHISTDNDEVFRMTESGFAITDKILESERVPALSERAGKLLFVASSKNGSILIRDAIGFPEQIFAGGLALMESNEPRESAEWRGALSELVTRGFVQMRDEKSAHVTQQGYEYQDRVDKNVTQS